MPSPVEWLLLIIHVMLLVAVEFMSIHLVDKFYDLGLIMGLIPMVAIAGGALVALSHDVSYYPVANRGKDRVGTGL